MARSVERPRLGFWQAIALVIGHTIGVGIFLTPAEVIGSLASPAITFALWIGCGLLVLAGALTFGELAARYPMAGGPYIYLREGWGERLAFLYGWQSALILDPGITAALAVGVSEYLTVLWPSAVGRERLLSVAVIWLIAPIAMSGLKLSARTLGVFTLLKVLAIAAIGVLAFSIGRGSFSNFVPPPGVPLTRPLGESLAAALVGIFFSFGGFWEASRMAGEIERPARTLPRALAAGVAVVTAIYVITTGAFIYLAPPRSLTSAPEFARRAGEALLGAYGPSAFAFIVVLSVAVSMLALLVMAPRVYVAMSDDGVFPHLIGLVSPATQTPVRATALTATLATVMVLAGNFQQIVAFFICTSVGLVAVAAAALFVVRRRQPVSPFRVPGYPFTPAVFVAFMLIVIVLIAANRPLQAGSGFALLLLGVPAHAVFVARRAASARQVMEGAQQ